MEEGPACAAGPAELTLLAGFADLHEAMLSTMEGSRECLVVMSPSGAIAEDGPGGPTARPGRE